MQIATSIIALLSAALFPLCLLAARDMPQVPSVLSLAVLLATVLAMLGYAHTRKIVAASRKISRELAFGAFVLVVIGFYLAGTGLAGDWLNPLENGYLLALVILTILVGGRALLDTTLLKTARSSFDGWSGREHYREKYDYCAQWHKFTDRLALSQNGNALLPSVISGFCETFAMKTGALFLLVQEQGEYRCVAHAGLHHALDACVDAQVVATLLSNREIVDLRCEAKPARAGYLQYGCLFAGSRYIVPLCSAEGLDGFVVLGCPVNAAETYRQEDFDLMAMLAQQASFALLSLRLSEQLARSHEMAAIGKVSAFVIHDLKNLGSTLSLLLTNARSHISQLDFQKDMLAALGATVTRMNAIFSRLTYQSENMLLRREPVDLLQLAKETAGQINGAVFTVTGNTVVAHVDRDEFRKVIFNLMINAVEASPENGSVNVTVGTNSAPYVRVTDSGCGIKADFLHSSLFRPFCSTKRNGMGIGLYQSKQIIEAHGGTIEVESEPERGSAFTVRLPTAS